MELFALCLFATTWMRVAFAVRQVTVFDVILNLVNLVLNTKFSVGLKFGSQQLIGPRRRWEKWWVNKITILLSMFYFYFNRYSAIFMLWHKRMRSNSNLVTQRHNSLFTEIQTHTSHTPPPRAVTSIYSINEWVTSVSVTACQWPAWPVSLTHPFTGQC